MSNFLQLHGLQPTGLLCPWNFPGKNTGVCFHFLLQGIFPTQRLNPGVPHCRQTLYHMILQGSPSHLKVITKSKAPTALTPSCTRSSFLFHPEHPSPGNAVTTSHRRGRGRAWRGPGLGCLTSGPPPPVGSQANDKLLRAPRRSRGASIPGGL